MPKATRRFWHEAARILVGESEELSPIFTDIQVTTDYVSAFCAPLLINFQPVMHSFCDLL
ncbi:hypothetical protein AGR6A_Lc90127 [Agrobacterium sp. NCPPB 925]|nr:hypothetical protein AGR6A_Lc90127 [Agrobacterium sp. NCPPB 925]